jgi:colanic acid/amylovoran biosynthesis glycosyltransferase
MEAGANPGSASAPPGTVMKMKSSPGRVVLILSAFPTLSETFIAYKFLGLLARGWDVHIACAQTSKAAWDEIPELHSAKNLQRRVHVHWPDRPRWLAGLLLPLALLGCLVGAPKQTWRYLRRGWRRFGWGVFRWLYLDADLIRLRPDLLHFEFGSLAPERMHLKELLDCRVVVSFRGYDLNYVGLDRPGYYTPVWEQADALHLLGQDLWQRAQNRGCPAEKPHALIPPSIDVAEFSPGVLDAEDDPERPLRVLSVGRMDWRKGYEYSLQAIRTLLDQGIACEVRFLGGGEYLEPVAFARHQLGLEGKVELLGMQARRAVKQQMLWADVFLHAAVSEGFCNAVIEAQAMALPVVCSDAGGLPENVADGETGFVVPRRDPQALAEKLALLAGDPDLRRRMGMAGRERVLRCFRLEDQISAFERLYRELLG